MFKNKIRTSMVAAATAVMVATGATQAQAAYTNNVGDLCASQNYMYIENTSGQTMTLKWCQSSAGFSAFAGKVLYFRFPQYCWGYEVNTHIWYHDITWWKVDPNQSNSYVFNVQC